MSLEAIKTINEAEDKAKKIIADAASEAKRAETQAHAGGRADLKSAASRASDELRELVKKADAKAKSDASELAAATENKKAAMRARADSRLDAAARIVLERIVNS